jgi:hypothetical protein
MGAERQVFVVEHAPHTDDFEELGFVGIDQELISHKNGVRHLVPQIFRWK